MNVCIYRVMDISIYIYGLGHLMTCLSSVVSQRGYSGFGAPSEPPRI